MFQNIANGINEKDSHYKDVKLKNEEIGMFFRRAFTRQNIIIYIIAYI